jgi:hypothetical protein
MVVSALICVVVVAGVLVFYGASGTTVGDNTSSSSTIPPTTTTSTPPPPTGLRTSLDHECLKPDETTVPSIRPDLCIIAWCEGGVYTSAGLLDPTRTTIKIRPGILNKGTNPLDISIAYPSSMRLLVSGSNLRESWDPPPFTAAAGDKPLLVEWAGRKYWAVAPNLQGEPMYEVTSPDNLTRYQRFKTFWDDQVLSDGESYFRSIKKISEDPDAPAFQEADLVFEIPMGTIMEGLAIVDRGNPTDVLQVSLAGPKAENWPVSREPFSF